MSQNLENRHYLSPRAHPQQALAIAWAVYSQILPSGKTGVYVNAQNLITMQTYPAIPAIGWTPSQYGRGLIFHMEGDHNAPYFLAIDPPALESYVPLWQGYTTLQAGDTLPGLAPYPFPGSQSVTWALEVVGGGSGTVTVGSATITIPTTYGRSPRIPLTGTETGTALLPVITLTGTTTLGGIFLVGTINTIPPLGGA